MPDDLPVPASHPPPGGRTVDALAALGEALVGTFAPTRHAVATRLNDRLREYRRIRWEWFGTGLAPGGADEAERLLTLAVDDDALLGLFGRAAGAAADARSREKAEALGRALRKGLLAADGARVDDAEALVAAFAVIDVPHLRLLLLLKEHHDLYYTDPEGNQKGRAGWYGMTSKEVAARWEGADHMVSPLAATLVREGLADDTGPETWAGGRQWAITPWGERVLDHWQGDAG